MQAQTEAQTGQSTANAVKGLIAGASSLASVVKNALGPASAAQADAAPATQQVVSVPEQDSLAQHHGVTVSVPAGHSIGLQTWCTLSCRTENATSGAEQAGQLRVQSCVYSQSRQGLPCAEPGSPGAVSGATGAGAVQLCCCQPASGLLPADSHPLCKPAGEPESAP